MSGSVGTIRAGSNRQSAGTKDKMAKSERSTSSQQQQQQSLPATKPETQPNKLQPTQEQLRLAQIITTNLLDADVETVRELMAMTDKSEDDVRTALHDAENDANMAVMLLIEGGVEQQGEWREQGKRKKKVTPATSQKEAPNHIDENSEGRNKERLDKEDRDKDASTEHHDYPPRRGRRNGVPPPRLARGRGRDRGNFLDRDSKDRNNEEWNNEEEEKRDRSGGDRGRSRGRGGFRGRWSSGRGRFNNSSDRDSRSYNRVPRFEKMNNSQPQDGPEIDLWTNETAETNTSKDTDWDNWNDTWVNEEDQWTGSLEETKVFTPSQGKIPDPEPALADSRGQRVDVGSLFMESAKFSKAPDYSKPSGDPYLNQFKQAATESIKNTIGIGSSSTRPAQPISSLSMSQQSVTNSLGLSSLSQSSEQVQRGMMSMSQQSSQPTMTQLSQMTLASQQAQMSSQQAQLTSQQAQMSSQQAQMSNQQAQMSNQQAQMGPQQPMGAVEQQSAQSRLPSVQQQQQQQQNIPVSASHTSNLQQRPKPQKTKMPPPSKIPASAVEMPGHIPRNPQLDLQFGLDFGVESSPSFGFGSSDNVSTSTYTTISVTNGIMSSPSAGSTKTQPAMEAQSSRQPAVFHNSVFSASPPKSDSQSLEREQAKISGGDSLAYSSQLDQHKSNPVTAQRVVQTNQNLSAGLLSQGKNESTNYSSSNGFTPSTYQNHQKVSAVTQAQTFSHSTGSQVSQTSFQGQYPTNQSAYPSAGSAQFSSSQNASQYAPTGPASAYAGGPQSQYTGQSQYASVSSSSLPSMPHANHQSQYSSSHSSSYSSGQSQYTGYQTGAAYTSHPASQNNYPPSSQTSSGGSGSSLYPVSSAPASNSFSSQTTYQSPSAGSYHPRESQASTASTQSSSGVTFPVAAAAQSTLKPATSQTNTNYNSQNFSGQPVTLQPSPLTNKLGEGLSKITMKEEASLDSLQVSQYDHASTAVTTVSTSLSLSSTASTATLTTGTTTISSTSTATSITPTSRIASMPSTSKAPPNLPPGVPLMGQYIMGQSTIPPFYSMQPPLYGYEDVQLLQQRMPLQTGSYYDMSAYPAAAGSTIPTGRDQQQALPNVPYTGTTADTSKLARVDAQSPNSGSQPQTSHSATQQPLFNFHYGYYYPSMFPGGGLQYPMFPIPPVTNAAAHAGTTANSQFQKTYAPHVYTTKGYDELNQAQDFSKTGYGNSPTGGKASGTRTGSSEINPNVFTKTHTQAYEKQGFHGGTPPPFNLPIASATQAGPLGGPTTPYATAPFLPIMAPHQLHHPMQQDSAASRGLNQATSQTKTGTGKSYGTPYWNN